MLPFIDELVEMGVEVLNPIQVTARGMDPAALKAEYGRRLAFCGGIDQREVLPHGTPDDVELEVRRRIGQLGPGGGYVAAPTHDIQADTRSRMCWPCLRLAEEVGGYPLAVGSQE